MSEDKRPDGDDECCGNFIGGHPSNPKKCPLVIARASLRLADSELAESRKECMEQARLNGMGGEREAKLLSELSTLRAENEALRADDVTASPYRHLACKVRWEAAEAKVARLAEALKEVLGRIKNPMSVKFRENTVTVNLHELADYVRAAVRDTEGGAKHG